MVELAGRNLREAGLRNSLTTLGIGVGVASLVAMVSLGVGLQRLFNQALGRSGLFDSVFVTQRQDIRGTRLAQGDLTPPKPLDDAARQSFEKVQGVQEVYSYFIAMGEFRLEDTRPEDSHFSVVGGLPPSARNSEAFDDFQGQFFSSEDAPEAIILADFGRLLLDLPTEPANSEKSLTPDQVEKLLGKNLILRFGQRSNDTPPGAAAQGDPAGDTSAFNVVRKEQDLKIVGIVNNEPYRGFGGGPGRRAVLLPVAFAESLNMMQPNDVRSLISAGQGRRYNSLVVRVKKSQDVPRVEEQVKKLGFNAFSIHDASQYITKVFRFVDMFLVIFGSLALAVASLGIVNTLVMAVLERRREIGIMKALGASDGDVKRIFFVEAGCMGTFGGALGASLGWLIGRAINFGTNIYLETWVDTKPQNFWYVPLWLALAAIGFSVVVSLSAGLYPASRAAKLDPVQALRHE